MASGAELGHGYLSLTIEAEGIDAELQEKIGGPAEKEGTEAGKKAGKSFGESFGKAAETAAAVSIGAVGAGLAVGVLSGMSAEVSNDKLAASMGINNPEYAQSLGKIAGQVYAGNFGESLGEVNAAMKVVLQQGLIPEDAADADIKRITEKVLTLAGTMDQDLGETGRAISTMLANDLAPNADAAMDILTRGFQQGADKAGDLIDTTNEYSVQFKKLGLDGTEAMGLLSQGLKAGARDSDTVADALKEFSIRAIDGSKLTGEAYAALGLDAQTMQAKIAGGGEGAQQGLEEVLNKLRGMEDPAAQAAAAVGLFGTKAEDMGAAMFALKPERAVAFMGDVEGAADKMAATVGDNASGKFETFKRRAEVALQGVTSAMGPVLSMAPALGGLATVAGTLSGPLKAAGSAMSSLGLSVLKTAGHVVMSTAAWIAHNVAKGAAAVVSGVVTAAQWLLNAAMSANPIMLVVLAIAALVAALVLAYQNSETFRNIVQSIASFFTDTLWPVLRSVGEFIGMILVGYVKAIIAYLTLWWEALQLLGRVAAEVVQWVVAKLGEVVSFIAGIPGRVADVLGSVFRPLLDAMGTAYNFVHDRVGDIVGFITGIPGRVGNVFSGMFDGITGAMRSAVNAVAGLWNRTVGRLSFTIPDWVPGLGGNGFDVPDIPYLARGGLARSATQAIVGEASSRLNPEVIAPLDKLRGMLDLPAPVAAGDTVFNLRTEANPHAIARAVAFRRKVAGR